MNFENGLVALRKGFKIIRRSQKHRLNAVCLFMKDGVIWTEQVHPDSEHKKDTPLNLPTRAICANDWEAFK